MAENSILLVLSNPTAGQDDAYNEWYDGTHLADVLKVPGVCAAQRFELAPMNSPEAQEIGSSDHRYLAIYELDGDPDEVTGEFLRRIGSGEMTLSESLDMDTILMRSWRPRGSRRTA